MKRWAHQESAYQFLKERTHGALFMDMGTGKTKVMIDTIIDKGFSKVLVVCPKSVCPVWVKQLNIHATVDCAVLNMADMTGAEKTIALKQFWKEPGLRVAVCNYDSVWREPLKDLLLTKAIPDAVICDESHRIKTAGSKVSRFMALLGKRVQHRYCMTGTPLPNSPLDVYGQYRFMAPYIFGTSLERFTHEYAIVTNMWGYDEIQGIKPHMIEPLNKKIYSVAFRVTAADVLDLPDKQDITIEYTLSKTAQKYYTQLRQEGCLELEQGILTTKTAIALVGRLQQICSGYAPVYDDNGAETIVEVDDGRMQALSDLLEDIDRNEPVVVFCKYRKDLKNVMEIASKLKRPSYEISGRINQYAEFIDGDPGIIAVQMQAGSAGIDLTRAKYCVYYSMTYSLGDYEQSRARVYRPGQTRPVVYYTIIAKHPKYKTIDEQIAEALRDKQDLVEKVMKELK